jgi:hypothetical protein
LSETAQERGLNYEQIMGASGVNHDWTAAEDALLGKISDNEAARRIGLTPLSICRRRRKLGIASYKPFPQKPRESPPIKHATPSSNADKRIANMEAGEYAMVANQMRAGLCGKKPIPPKQMARRPRARPLLVPLDDLLDGKRIQDLNADELLALAREIARLKRSDPRT